MAERDMLVHVFTERPHEGHVHANFHAYLSDGTRLSSRWFVDDLADELFDLYLYPEEGRDRVLQISFTPLFEDGYFLTSASETFGEMSMVPFTSALRKKFRKALRDRRHYSGLRYQRESEEDDVPMSTAHIEPA